MGASYPDGSTKKMCRVALQQGSPNSPFWILGDVFLRKVYAVHDVLGQQVVLFHRLTPSLASPSSVALMEVALHPTAGLSVLGAGALLATVLLRRSRNSAGGRLDEGNSY